MRSKYLKTGRREFLKSLPVVSGSTGFAVGLPDVVHTSRRNRDRVRRTEAYVHTNHEEVVSEGTKPEREPVYYTIPYDRWVRIEATDDASKRINKKVRELSSHPLIRVGVTTTASGHKQKRSVVVERSIIQKGDRIIEPDTSLQKIKGAIPSTARGEVSREGKKEVIDGIPVNVRSRKLTVADCTAADEEPYNYDCAYFDVPAGARFSGENPEADDGFAHATLGTPAYSDDLGEYVMVTAGHICGDGAGGDLNDRKDGRTVHQPTDLYSNFGWIYESKYEPEEDPYSEKEIYFDGAYIALESDEYVSHGFAQNDGTVTDDEQVAGSYAWDKITDGGTLTKQGAATTRTSGKIQNYWQDGSFEVKDESEQGDSGGPNFTQTDYYYGTKYMSIAGFLSYVIPFEDIGGYYHSGHIESEFSLTI